MVMTRSLPYPKQVKLPAMMTTLQLQYEQQVKKKNETLSINEDFVQFLNFSAKQTALTAMY